MSILRAIAVFLCGFICLRCCNAQVPFFGPCPNVSVVTNFEPSKYLGKWFEAEKYFAIFQIGGQCITATYSDKGNGLVRVINRQRDPTGFGSEIQGTATLTSKTGEAKLSVVFPRLPISIPAPYWVIDTDYDNYAVVWGCNDLGILHTRNVWILTRARKPAVDVLQKAYAALDRANLSKELLTKTYQQSDCPDNY